MQDGEQLKGETGKAVFQEQGAINKHGKMDSGDFCGE